MRKSPLRFSLAKGFPRCKTTMKSTRPTRSGGGRLAEQTLSQGAHLPCSHLSDGTGFNSSFVIPVCSVYVVSFQLYLFSKLLWHRGLWREEFGMRLEPEEGGLQRCSGKGLFCLPTFIRKHTSYFPRKVSSPIWDGGGGSGVEVGSWSPWSGDELRGWAGGSGRAQPGRREGRGGRCLRRQHWQASGHLRRSKGESSRRRYNFAFGVVFWHSVFRWSSESNPKWHYGSEESCRWWPPSLGCNWGSSEEVFPPQCLFININH